MESQMNYDEVAAMRKAFKTVIERQGINIPPDFEKKKKQLRAVRELCVGNDTLIKTTISNIEKNGIIVHVAREKHEAFEIILNEIGEEKLVVKSKSNVTKEIELTKTLEKNGIIVIETDIGDRILQRLDLSPSHPTGPISHISAKDIAKKFSAQGIHTGETPEEIVKFIREEISENIQKSNIGITGANALTAEEGSIIITHNEGNISEVRRKKKHIILTSIDKIYPNIEEAVNMLKILSFNATGATIPSFVDIISGVSKTADVEKKFFRGIHPPEKVVLIILDNKRSEIISRGYRELLYCIGCGNCLLHCPMYNTIGNMYGKDNYLGGKGIAYNSLCSGEMENLDLCLTCGKCRDNCPLEIDLPGIIRELRGKDIPNDVYFFLRSHFYWVYYNLSMKLKG
jgi:L-lactate utilization protein LutB